MSVHIVTDSCAQFTDPQYLAQNPVTVVPNRLIIGGDEYCEGVDITDADALQLIAQQSTVPIVKSPTTQDYKRVYGELARHHDVIVSIHASRDIFDSWQNARLAAQQVAGSCRIYVVDSQTLCAAQGMVVKVAVEASRQEEDEDAIVRKVRGAVDRTYAVYYVESLHYLMQNKLMSPSHTILGSFLDLKPFVTIEDGKITLIEKVKSRGQALERLVEFVTEFTDLQDVAILQQRPVATEQTRNLQERLALEFPDMEFPFSVYRPSFAALIGTSAVGIVVLEEEWDSLVNAV